MPVPQEVCRKDYVSGVPIILDDGREWDFPVPRRQYSVPRSDLGQTEWQEVETYRDDNRHYTRAYWDRQAQLIAYTDAAKARSMEGFDLGEWLRIAFPLAVDLLRRNYSLTDDQVRDLMPYAPNDPGNLQMWQNIAAVICYVEADPNYRATTEANPPAADAA